MTKASNQIHDKILAPAFPVHPGLVLKLDVLPARSVKGSELAIAIDYARPGLTKVLNGQKPVTPALALRIERAIGYPADLLVAMQGMFDLSAARRDSAETLDRVREIALAG